MSERHENPAKTSEHGYQSEKPVRNTRPVKGRYLKQNPPQKHRRRRRRRRKLNPRFVVLMAVLLALLIVIAVGIRSCTKPTIQGLWDLDGTTSYEFGKGGNGALILIHTKYEFHYTVNGDLLTIDFVDEAALDAKYTFQIEKDMLFLTGGPGDARNEFVLRLVE